ncbi:MAG TPA: tRNA (guanosine(46)-N7)-methyltransferase TrmB [Burkholderiaceae bacterium]|nr:tRNA (guanosine(46)-N7)-methyltransferase TrmB [Burkholderiaceae bacterium]
MAPIPERVDVAPPDVDETEVAGTGVAAPEAARADDAPVDRSPIDETPVDETRADDAPADDAPVDAAAGRPRHIRSFVMRRGHLSDAQRDAHAALMPRYGVPEGDGPIDFEALFGRRAPVVLEIGFGMGVATAAIAAARPDVDFLGVEVYTPGVGSLLRLVHAQGLANVRVIQRDAVEVLRERIAPGSLAGVHVYFPDPWPKARHHKRRLIQPPFVAELAGRIAPGGYLHCATDWEPYAERMLEVLSGEPALENTADGFAPRPAWRPLTKFERRGLRLGHGVRDLMFVRRGETVR